MAKNESALVNYITATKLATQINYTVLFCLVCIFNLAVILLLKFAALLAVTLLEEIRSTCYRVLFSFDSCLMVRDQMAAFRYI